MEKKETRVDVGDDGLMVHLGFRTPPYIPPSGLFDRTDKEKKTLQSLRKKTKGKSHFGIKSPVVIPVRDKLIVYLKKNKIFDQSVYSHKCMQHEIPQIIGYFNHDKDIVLKYQFNGKTYKPNELPYYYGK